MHGRRDTKGRGCFSPYHAKQLASMQIRGVSLRYVDDVEFLQYVSATP